jgi:signal transduction histidine kinase
VVHVDRLHKALELGDLPGFEVALTDLTLPDAQGLETVKRLRTQAPDLPLVVLTSMADDRLAQEALGQGAQDYLSKEEFIGNSALAAGLLGRAMRYAVFREGVMRENRRLVGSLQDSKTLLERKNERLRALCDTAQKFVENVSHDFRTPLTVIKEYSSLIRDGVVGEVTAEQRRMLHVVEDRADDLNTMVDDLLDVSKLEAGLLHVWRRRTEISRIVEHIIPGLERKAAVRGVSLVNSIDDSLPAVFCDEDKVGRVVVNLVTNAIKFCSDSGRVELWARADAECHEVVVGVTDNGPGIPAHKLDKIFERFAQGSAHLRQVAKGFGLGLSIARELIDLNLGRIDVSSVVGAGSTFTFSVPYADVEEVFARYICRTRALDGDCAVCAPLTITADPAASARDLDDLDVFLSHNVRGNDLALRVENARWLVVLYVPPVELEDFVNRTLVEMADLNRNRPLGPLPTIEFHHEEPLLLTDQLASLRKTVAPLLRAQELCYG